MTGALPDGRPAGWRLSNGLSPVDGADRTGPTAVLRSAGSLDSRKWANCFALNLKFDKKVVQGNVLDADTLRQAKVDPSAYPGIVVRVAGYCAYFNDLQPAIQDEIIERTAHGVG